MTRPAAAVVQGGGMRGVYSMGALAELARSSWFGQIGTIHGSSAGALNATYAAAGQADIGVKMFVEDLGGSDFIVKSRIWKIVDIDYLIDVVMKQHNPLDVDALRSSPVEVVTTLTDASTGRAKYVSSYDNVDPYEVMRATAALPSLYNKRVVVPGLGTFVDGGIADSVPIRRAATDDTTTVFVISTRPFGYRSLGPPLWYRLGARLLARGQSERIVSSITNIDDRLNSSMDYIEGGDSELVAMGTGYRIYRRTDTNLTIASVAPSDENRLVGRTTSDQVDLQRCADMAAADIAGAIAELG